MFNCPEYLQINGLIYIDWIFIGSSSNRNVIFFRWISQQYLKFMLWKMVNRLQLLCKMQFHILIGLKFGIFPIHNIILIFSFVEKNVYCINRFFTAKPLWLRIYNRNCKRRFIKIMTLLWEIYRTNRRMNKW